MDRTPRTSCWGRVLWWSTQTVTSPPPQDFSSFRFHYYSEDFGTDGLNGIGVLFEGAAGRVDIASDSKPWTLDTIAMVASMTKLPAVISILQVVEKGLLTLDEDLRPRLKALAATQVLKGFDEATGQPIYEDIKIPITLRLLLTHTAGFAYDLPEPNLMRWRQFTGNVKVNNTATLEGLHTPAMFVPGTEWKYGTNIEWATLALEQVTGKSLHTYMKENIFEPLGMENSFIGPKNVGPNLTTEELRTRIASVPFRTPEGDFVPGELPYPLDDYEIQMGGAALLTTARDYSKILRAVLEGELISEQIRELLFKPQLEGDILKSLRDNLAVFRPVLAPEYEDDTPTNFAYGGMLNLEDLPGKRPKGSLQWSGYTNPHWVSFHLL